MKKRLAIIIFFIYAAVCLLAGGYLIRGVLTEKHETKELQDFADIPMNGEGPFEFTTAPIDELVFYAKGDVPIYEGPDEGDFPMVDQLEKHEEVTVTGRVTVYGVEAVDWLRIKTFDERAEGYVLTCDLTQEETMIADGQDTQETDPDGVELTDCMLRDSNTVEVSIHTIRMPDSDDGMMYILTQKLYEEEGIGTEAASAPIAKDNVFTISLNNNTQDSLLYNRFCAAVLQDGQFVKLTQSQYISNPEVLADHTVERYPADKKGILPAAALIQSNSLSRLHVTQATYNVPLGNLCSGGGINYTYNGKTYSFNSGIVGQYDIVVPRLNKQGIQVTLILLNNAGGGNLIHPAARGTSANYYAFNTAEQAGAEKLAAAAAFMTERYSNQGHGQVDNWIIGNEVNARAVWHNMKTDSLDTFTDAYAKAFRLFYNAILSKNANAKLYISLDQQWGQSSDASRYYAAKDLLDVFNTKIKQTGDIFWNLAIHPYNHPMTNAKVWEDNAAVVDSWNSPYVTMKNIHIVTDYMMQEQFLNPNGQVRGVFCSEVGYTSSSSQANQAASIIYAYEQCKSNDYIDGFILARELDAAEEIRDGLATGVLNQSTSQKTSFDWYANIDLNEEVYISKASEVMGVADLRTLLTPRTKQ